MPISYNTLNIENQNAINSKASGKKDGVYTFRGIAYRVKDGRVIAFACRGEIIQQYGHFNTVIGSYDDCYQANAAKALKVMKV